MKARLQAEAWLSRGLGPDDLLSLICADLIVASPEDEPILHRALTYLVQVMTPSSMKSALLKSMGPHPLALPPSPATTALEAEIETLSRQLDERRTQYSSIIADLDRLKQRERVLSEEIANLRAVLSNLPEMEGGNGLDD